MKKIIAAVLCLILALSIVGCGNQSANQNIYKMQGTVIDYTMSFNEDGSFIDGNMIVEPLEGFNELKTSDKFCISLEEPQALELGDIEQGDIVEIIYAGDIEETTPPKLCNVSDIQIIQKVSDEILYELPDIEVEDGESAKVISKS